jgi:hypothetical protein
MNPRLTSPCHQLPAGLFIVGISAGRYNSLALDSNGVLHTWGLDACGSQGLPPPRLDAWKPRPVQEGMRGEKVVSFDSGAKLRGKLR